MAVAEPSLSNVIDSTSSSLRSIIRVREISKPSIIIRGVLRSVLVLSCRSVIVGRFADPLS